MVTCAHVVTAATDEIPDSPATVRPEFPLLARRDGDRDPSS